MHATRDKNYSESAGPVFHGVGRVLAVPFIFGRGVLPVVCVVNSGILMCIKSVALAGYQVCTISQSQVSLFDGMTATVRSIFKLLMMWALCQAASGNVLTP